MRLFGKKIPTMNCFRSNDENPSLEDDDYYKVIIDKFPFNFKTDNFKSFVLLLTFAVINSHNTFNNPKVVRGMILADDNVDLYVHIKRYCNNTQKCNNLFKNDLKMIASFFYKNAPGAFSKICENLSFYFPAVNPYLIHDFQSLQNVILNNNEDLYLNSIYKSVNDYFYAIIKNRYLKWELTTLINFYDILDDSTKSLIKSIMSENYDKCCLFLYAIKKFRMHPAILKLIENQNKCCIEMLEFIRYFEIKLKKNNASLQKIGPSLATPFYTFGKSDGFIMAVIGLMCIKTKRINYKEIEIEQYMHFYLGFRHQLYSKNFLKSVQESHNDFLIIKKFILEHMGHENITSYTLKEVRFSIKSLLNSIYFKNLVAIYNNEMLKDFKKIMNGCLKRLLPEIYP